jgi:hypothetical protein
MTTAPRLRTHFGDYCARELSAPRRRTGQSRSSRTFGSSDIHTPRSDLACGNSETTCPPTDALYLALAETLADSVLMTSDSGLAANAAQILGETRVRHLV